MLTHKRNLLRAIASLGTVGFVALALWVVPGHALAGAYGRGGYSGCSYQKDCAQAPTDTTTTMPSGLQVSVNLVDGQVIPRNGYTILITPLNSATITAAIKQVAIYLDGVLVATVQPEDTGTARWVWQPAEHPAKQVKLVITGTDDSVTTDVFTVTIGGASDAQPGGTVAPKNNDEGGGIAQHVYNGAKQFVGKLPKRVVYGFPYVLFLLLGLNVVILLWQAIKELREYHVWQDLLGRERLRADERRTLMQLIAHYLRTPLTVLKGGIDMMTPTDTAVTAKLTGLAKRLQDEIEQLLQQTEQVVSGGGGESGSKGVGAFGVMMRHPGLVVPLVLVGAIVLSFDHLVDAAGKLNVSQVNVATQWVVFGLLAVVTYIVYRRVLLSRQDSAEAKHIYEQERALQRAGDELVDGVANTLRNDVLALDSIVSQLSASDPTAKYILDGTQRFKELATKLAVAAQLMHMSPSDTFSTVSLDALVSDASKPLNARVVERGVHIEQATSFDLAVRAPELLAYVLQTVLDNAIAYSPKGGVVRIEAVQEPGATSISIIDTGAGIPSDKQPLLFQPFSRVEKAEDFTHEGMGFSLYLDTLIMKYLGGGITVQSEVGHGTKVTLTLPKVVAPVVQ